MKTKKMNMKAQAAVMGLIFAFMLVATAAVLQEPLLQFIEIGINETINQTEHADLIIVIIQLLPLFMWLIVLVAVVALITGRQS